MRLYCQCQETKKWRVKKKMKSLGVYLKHYKKESIIALLENGKIIRDIDNKGNSAEKELEDYFNVTE